MSLRALSLFVVVGAVLTYFFVDAWDGDAPRAPRPADYDAQGVRTSGPGPVGPHPNLVVIVIDTLRADAVALPGTERGHMPYLSELAHRGVSCRRAFSPSAWTEPAMTSMLTGLLPREHGCIESGRVPRLPPSVATYAEILQRSYGYETAAFTDAIWHRTRPWSILQGFARGSTSLGFTQMDKRPMERGFWLQGADEILDDWLRDRNADQPFCLLLHTFDAHDPYGAKNRPARAGVRQAEARFEEAVAAFDTSAVDSPREATRLFLTDRIGRTKMVRQRGRRFAQEVAQYLDAGFSLKDDAAFARDMHSAYLDGVAEVDAGLRRTVAALTSRGLLENTLLVITSDHGEAFGEHGTLGHAHHLHAELTQVPMVILGPDVFSQQRVIERTVGLVDVFPTFFDWAGLDVPRGVIGQSMVPLVRDAGAERIVASETMVTADMAGPGARRLCVARRSDEWTFMATYDIAHGVVVENLFAADDVEELHDLAVDGVAQGEFPRAFCEAIDEARDVLWNEVRSASGRVGTAYGAGIEPVRTARPSPCATQR